MQGAAPVGGHFSLGFRGNGNVGKMLRWNATSNDVKEALENLNSIYNVGHEFCIGIRRLNVDRIGQHVGS